MRILLRALRDRLRRLPFATEGVAAVEFALVLPIMLLLYVGSVETSALISMDRRVQSVAGALGDLVARSDTTVKKAALEDYFKAAGGIMTPYPATELLQTVTQVRVRRNRTTNVEWSWQYVGGDLSAGPHAGGSAFTLPAAMVNVAHDASKDTFVIVSEGTYSYLPFYGIVLNRDILLHRQNFFMPRFGGSITIN